MQGCGALNHHDGHRWQSWEDCVMRSCPGIKPAITPTEALDRLRQWADVEPLPAQDQFDDILADLTRLVG